MTEDPAAATSPCAACLRRSWLIARLAGHIDVAWSTGRRRAGLLALADEELVTALGGAERVQIAAEYERFDAQAARARCEAAGVAALCRCDGRFPASLEELADPPAVVYVHGDPARAVRALTGDCVGIVGARRASPYGLEQARRLGRGLAACGLTIVSGMALGVDSAAHAGALEAEGVTVAVLAGGPERAYPTTKRRLHERIAATSAVIAEMPPGTRARRWCFPARNRIIAALARATVVVEASERSGSLITAGFAADLGREVAAVPGLVTAPLASGTNGLIADGAQLIRGPEDVLELLFGVETARRTAGAAHCAAATAPDALDPDLRALLDNVGSGMDTVAALTSGNTAIDAVLAGLAQLELRGLVRRGPGGRYVATG